MTQNTTALAQQTNNIEKWGMGNLVLSGANHSAAHFMSIRASSPPPTVRPSVRPPVSPTCSLKAAVQVQGNINIAAEPITVNGPGYTGDNDNATGALENVSGNNTWAGTVTVNSIATVPFVSIFTNGNYSLNTAGFIGSDSGNLTITVLLRPRQRHH